MIHLVIDIGNTFTKVAIFNNRDVVESSVYEGFGLTELKEIVNRHTIDKSIISSVDRDIADLEQCLNANSRYLRFHAEIPTQIKNHYKTPQTLGLDRLAGVIGARSIFPGKNSLVIDAGTCITYDFIDSGANYRGGSISPGLAMRFTAMNAYTERLPLVELDPEYNLYQGTDTKTAILSGVQHGAFKEALGFIEDYNAAYSGLQVILCGGDAKFFDSRLKNSIFANSVKLEPMLVLFGLNEVIHQHNND